MNEEKDFFKTCFNTVVGLEVKNESQAIAKEVVLSEIENLQQENKQLKEKIEYLERSNNRREDTILEQRQEISNLEDNWNELKENEKDKIILDKDMFDSLFPIGTIYYSYDKEQKFPYGEWEYRGCNSMAYFFKRIK